MIALGESEFKKTGIFDLEPGLWIWCARHPFWAPGDDYQQVVVSVFVESGGERILIDPLAPSLDCLDIWSRLDETPPSIIIATMPDHIRDLDLFVRRYNSKAFGPMFYFPDQVPHTKLTAVVAEIELPGGLMPLFDARGRAETPIFLPGYRYIVFGDALMEKNGELRVWDSPWNTKRELPALRAMLELPFEKVIISHFDQSPVHTREEFQKALELPPFRWV